jgi:hypothetical protein
MCSDEPTSLIIIGYSNSIGTGEVDMDLIQLVDVCSSYADISCLDGVADLKLHQSRILV